MSVGDVTAATISGPVRGGTRGRPWSTPAADLAAHGYVMEEFLLEGTARSYRAAAGSELSTDGRWTTEVDDEAPFRTRLLVVRPSEASTFNGTVVVQWLNVTAGYELGTADDDELLSGYAWVGVSAQKVGIDGFPEGSRPYSGRQARIDPLKRWDPERYGSLSHPGDRYSFDIFTHAARAVAPGRSTTPADPMGGLSAQRLIATGASQSAGRLITYINAVHPHEQLFDAFVPTITSGRGTGLGEQARAAGGSGSVARPLIRMRDDLTTPIMIVNSECEAEGMFSARRPDSDHFRFWEVAGAPHVVAVVPAAEPRPGGKVDNPLTYRPVLSAAYRHVHRWLEDGTPPPAQPRIEFTADERPTIKRDELGNAVGGIRLPELAAPIAEYRGRDDTAGGLGALYGWMRPFTNEELRRLYRSRGDYVAAYRAGVDALAASGALRPEDVSPMHARADEIASGLDL